MTKSIARSNNIKALCEKKGLTSLELAKKIGTSAPHMSRLINGHSPLKMKWLLKISAALKVPTSQISGIALDKKLSDTCDDTLLGSVMGWILESSDSYKIKLTRQETAKLTSFVYKEAMATPLTFAQTRDLARMVLKIKRLLAK